jgi:U2 small nuclear ribonucleoprotein A'
MVRLTAELLARAEERMNCFGDRELVLRSCAIPAIENLGAANDQFQTMDLTGNDITELGGFPLTKRLRMLLISSNSISSISPHFCKSVPFLTTLVLRYVVFCSICGWAIIYMMVRTLFFLLYDCDVITSFF